MACAQPRGAERPAFVLCLVPRVLRRVAPNVRADADRAGPVAVAHGGGPLGGGLLVHVAAGWVVLRVRQEGQTAPDELDLRAQMNNDEKQ